MLSCDKLLHLVNMVSSCASGKEVLEALCLLMLVAKKGPIGRVSASRELGLPERKVRRLIGALRRCELVAVDRAAGAAVSQQFVEEVLRQFKSAELGGRFITVVEGIEDELRLAVESKVVALRDMLVVTASDPEVIEIIALVEDDSKVRIPGVPLGLAKAYSEVLIKASSSLCTAAPCLVVMWGSYREWFSEAMLLNCLASLCRLLELQHRS